jgi:hypothetical protein
METVPIGEAVRLGNAVNALPVEVDRRVGNVIRMPAWTSFVFALVANPERAFVVTDPGEAASLRDWVTQHAPGSVTEE